MSFKYNKTLVIGATSGIGWALAEKIVQDGKQVVIVGRRKERLNEFTQRFGSGKVDSVVFDISKLDDIPGFAQEVTKKHPDLDCVCLNAGFQRRFDFAEPAKVDLELLGLEFTTNYLSYVHLTTAFIPFLQKRDGETSLIYTTSGLALVPMPPCPNYSASKAALHHLVLVLREQLGSGPGNIKVIEIIPPAVQTELHGEGGKQIGMPLEEFMDEAWGKLENGHEQISVGFATKACEAFEGKRQEMFKQLVAFTKK